MVNVSMGCLFSKSGSGDLGPFEDQEAPKQYSWDKREKIDPKDFTIENVKDGTAGRLPGKVNGQQFIIQNCENATIYIFDHCGQVTIDDCKNCKFFLGPIKGSVFIRDCNDCDMIAACQQFRTRDCKKINFFLSCVSQPIIESSTSMKFGCYQYFYPELEQQFKGAGLSIYNNNWSNIHDFTPVPDATNFSLLPETANPTDYVPMPTMEPFSSMAISTSSDSSIVPRTLGTRRKPSEESCLVVFFSDGLSHERAKSFIKEMKDHHTSCSLVQSKEITMQPAEAQRVFGTDSYSMAVSSGPVIGLEYNGVDVCTACHQTLVVVSKGSTGLVFVSQTSAAAASQIDNFYNFADMQMNA